jgi:hypothetical protein
MMSTRTETYTKQRKDWELRTLSTAYSKASGEASSTDKMLSYYFLQFNCDPRSNRQWKIQLSSPTGKGKEKVYRKECYGVHNESRITIIALQTWRAQYEYSYWGSRRWSSLQVKSSSMQNFVKLWCPLIILSMLLLKAEANSVVDEGGEREKITAFKIIKV